MKLRNLILTFGLVSTIGSISAQSKLVVNTNDGKSVSIPVTTITDIKFSDGDMVITATDGISTYALGDLTDIKFDVKISAADDLATKLDDIAISVQNGVLTASTDSSLSLQVYDMKGAVIAVLKGNDELSFDLKQLQKGVYVVRVNNKTIKLNR